MSMIEKIKTKEVKTFTALSLERYAEGKASIAGEKTAEVVYEQLEEKGFVSEYSDPTFADVMISAALLHDLFSNESEGWITVFYSRLYLKEIADAERLPESTAKAIFEAIEGQMGEKTVVPRVRPQPGTPQELFANSVWFVYKYLV